MPHVIVLVYTLALTFFFSTAPTGSPSMTVLGVTSDTIQLQWTEVPEEHRNGEITNYILEYFSNRNGSVTVSAVLEHALPALPCTSYRLRIAAVNSAGQGPPSDNITCQTLESSKNISMRLKHCTLSLYSSH